MVMKGKWLRPISAPGAPAIKDEKPLMPTDDFNCRIAAFKKARGLAETFRLTTFCQQQRKHFVTTFERYGPGELFKRVCMEEVAASNSRFGGKKQNVQQFNISDVAAWECACDRRSFVLCDCGRISCQPPDGNWSCMPGCGRSGPLVPLRSIDGSKGGGGASKFAKSSSALFKTTGPPLLPRR